MMSYIRGNPLHMSTVVENSAMLSCTGIWKVTSVEGDTC